MRCHGLSEFSRSAGRIGTALSAAVVLLYGLVARPIMAAEVTWVGTTGGDWSTTTNWSDGLAPSAVNTYLVDGAGKTVNTPSGGNATFAGSSLTISGGSRLDLYRVNGGGNVNTTYTIPALTIDGGTLSPRSSTGSVTQILANRPTFANAVTVQMNNGGSFTNQLTFTDGYTGSGTLNIVRGGTTGTSRIVNVNGTSSTSGYSGTVTVSGNASSDTVQVNINTASGWGAGDLSIGDHATVNVSTAMTGTGGSVTISGIGTLSGGTVNGSSYSVTNTTGTATISASLAGAGGLTKTGGGTLAISGANTYGGGTTVGGTASDTAMVVTVSGDQSAATGGWIIDDQNQATTRTTTVDFQPGSTVAVGSGNTIRIGGTAGHFGARTLNAAGTLTNDGTLLVRRSSTVNVTGAWIQNGAATLATQGGGQAALNVGGGATLTYASATPFRLDTSASVNTVTTLTVSGGTLVTGTGFHNNTGTAVSGSFAQVILDDGGVLRLSTAVTDLATTNGGGMRFLVGATGAGGVIDTNGFNATLAQPIGDVASQAGTLAKQGIGTLALTAANEYSGGTTVSAGTLLVSNTSGSGTGAGLVTVAAGATLGGSGSISGATTIDGTHSPGASPGLQTFSGGLAYGSGSSLLWELSSNTDQQPFRGSLYDGIDVTGGSLEIAAGATINLDFTAPWSNGTTPSDVSWTNAFWNADRSWTVIEFSSAAPATSTGLFTLGTVGPDSLGRSLNSVPGRENASFAIVRSGDDVVLQYSAVPEPGSLATLAAAAGLAATGWLRLRRRR